ncbi:MAG: M48 family metalloprotease [Armatimonadetes bacterium]|nr:M48 family metalloprotease [Armatimonadota bacterium]
MLPVWSQKPTPEEKHKEELKKDVELGKEYTTEIEKDLKLSDDTSLIERVQRVGSELAAIANATQVQGTYGDSRLNAFEYVFKVVKDEDVNAFSVPGGFVYVNSGLLKDVESDDELAAVLAHEIAHASHRHLITLTKERNKVDMLTLPLILAAVLGQSREAGNLVMTQQLLSTALTSGWSEKAELDSDKTGFAYILKSKYHPVAMLTFMERLAFKERRNSAKIDWGIYRTHPPSRKRVDALHALLQAADVPVARSKVTTSYRVTVTPGEGKSTLKFGDNVLFALEGADATARAEALVPKLNDFFDSSPKMFSIRLLGEKLVWNGRPLVELRTGDTAAPEALANIKKSLFSLDYRTGG